jgi:PAS domain S-box-containing protein
MPTDPDRDLIARLSEAGVSESGLFRFLLENIPDRIYFKDTQSRFIRISHAMAKFFGLPTPLAAVGKTDFDFFGREHAEQALADEQFIMRTGEQIVGKVEKETLPDGELRWAITTKMPLRNAKGEIVGTCGVSKDFTSQKALEDNLAESNANLTEHQQQLETALADLQKTQQQLLDTQKELTIAQVAYKMAHDIRNPLNIVQAGLDALLAENNPANTASNAAILEEMRVAIERADGVIADVMK